MRFAIFHDNSLVDLQYNYHGNRHQRISSKKLISFPTIMEINLDTLQTPDDFLSFLITIGEKAKTLRQMRSTFGIDWAELRQYFFENAYPPPSVTSRVDHERWLSSLQSWAERSQIVSPASFRKEHAAQLAVELGRNGTLAARRFRFYRRVWRTVGLDDSIWKVAEALSPSEHEHYRRLTLREVRRLVSSTQQRSVDLADMITIGYSTGLRLSDVAELEKAEVNLCRRALQLVPNKVRHRKPHPLVIPLTKEAESIIRTRMKSIHANDRYLFPDKCRKHGSRQLEAMFKLAKISKAGNGRASFHSLRATFISMMDEAGIQPYITDAITGHAAGGMHARYTQPALSILRRAVLRAIPWVRTRCPLPDSEEEARLTSLNADRPFAESARRKKERTRQK